MPVFPLGSHVDDTGVRFAVASASAESVEVCLIDGADGTLTERRVELTERTFGVWHGHVPGVAAGQRYGYRVHGPYRPWQGLRANPAKILVDPYARRITGRVTDLDAARGWVDDPMTGASNERDSLGHVPLSVVTGPDGAPAHPRPDVPWSETVIAELHVRGYTKCHPEVPPEHRGTYLGLAHPAVTGHLRRIGVTAVELLPVTSIADEPPLLERGMPNYWGYATLGFLAPHAGYASVPGAEVAEFAVMVEALHAAGIEVILDIVPNHTAEGGVGGTTLSYRGLDAPAYYSLGGNGHDADITGTGNTLDAGSPTVIRLVCDAMRHWVTAFGVDGFRIDLASVLGRPRSGTFDPHAPLLTAIATDPVLSRVKLIAEPWDATGEGYRVGGFGVAWSEWNGRFRDAVRDFWRGHGGIGEVASRLTGSSDLYAASGRRPWASVNFVTAHDGFTLRDLVSYDRKHNEANGEGNRDGTDDNRSQNFGVEGPTTSPVVAGRRLSTARAVLATMLLSTGTPMLLGGDELWRTQGGNNNAYCLDDPTSWVDWTPGPAPASMTAFTARLTAIRRSSPALHRDSFYRDGEILWWHPAGRRLRGHDWHDGGLHSLGLQRGEWLLLLHAGADALAVTLPPDGPYRPELDSTRPDGVPAGTRPVPGGATITQPPRSLLLLRIP
ncbi:glycogen debranching protein GlgX [Pseudonocardia hydrocarbonoxydans]|uniref:Glycogen operon protein GlgX homolog n=1 Tax=Pseudonocardia hydrocarbonoxydans TaxID=76726 RepID=A0A4Y3WME2_9PSEU|nr:glycogen debranching protein GlgX [Pseudonocardia hydrocarbonoxydans]GEC19240.1 glycogen operon protein GlgX homolog [Pseudonocardia hydrocarbonoxydans]